MMRWSAAIKASVCLYGRQVMRSSFVSRMFSSCNPVVDHLTVGYTSDIEGDWWYWNHYVKNSKVLYKHSAGSDILLRDNCAFVFGGDVCDRGSGDLRIIQDLLSLKDRYPDRVFLILGNRDINKLRLPFALHPAALEHCDPVVYWSRNEGDRQAARAEVAKDCRVSKLKWILGKTMGAPLAFSSRQQELLEIHERPPTDNEVVSSFLNSLAPKGGPLIEYLKNAQIGLVLGDTLFVHGAVHDYNLGWVPGDLRIAGEKHTVCNNVRDWVTRINAFASGEVQDYILHSESYQDEMVKSHNLHDMLWDVHGGYHHPQPGSRLLQYGMGWTADRKQNPSVIYSSYMNAGSMMPMGEQTARWLTDSGVRRVVVGHKPMGDAPWIMDSHGVQIILADTAYSRNVQWPRKHLDRVFGRNSAPPSSEDFLSAAEYLAETSPKSPSHSTRSSVAVSEVIITIPRASAGEQAATRTELVGVLSDGSRLDFTVPSSSDNHIFGRQLRDEWTIKASGVRLPTETPGECTDREDELYLVSHISGFSFLNKLLTEAEVLKELEDSRHHVPKHL